MKNAILSTIFLAISLLIAACGGRESSVPPAEGGGQAVDRRPLTLKGSDTMVILGQRLAESYMNQNRGAVVQVNGGGSGTGIAALINGTADIAQSSRPMKEEEKQKVREGRQAEVVETPVALDSLAVFVNSANTVKELTIEQVASAFRGEVTNWKQLGGPDAPIVLYGRESSSGTYDYFREHVLAKKDFAPRVQTLQGTAAIINAVGRDRNGIGYGGIAYASNVTALGIRKDTASPAVAPTEATVADGSYPLSRFLYFYYPANAPERVTRFVEWVLTPDAQKLIDGVGYFPLTDTPQVMKPAASSN